MINRSALKSWSLDSLKGNWGTAIGAYLIYFVIVSVLSAVTSGIGSIFSGLVMLGYVAITLSLIRTKSAKINLMLSAATENFGTKFVSTLLVSLFTYLWSLLFVIPGIVKGYSYAMTNYILLDRPELGAADAITESRKMMDGHKMELFLLDLSFFGWYCLVVLTFGIASLYVTPYHMGARAAFYETLKSASTEVDSTAAENTATEETVA